MGVMIRDVDFLAQLVINTVLNRHEHSRAPLPKAGVPPLLLGWLRPWSLLRFLDAQLRALIGREVTSYKRGFQWA